MKWIVGSADHGCWLGTYEAQKQKAFVMATRPNQVVYDIGANVGFYSLLSAALVGVGGKVFAFEPVPRNLSYLKRHVRINNLRNVLIFDLALSDSCGVFAFQEGPSNAMGKLSNEGSLSVKTDTLDHLYDTGSVPDPDVLKIDVEGAEMRVLVGAEKMLRRGSPMIFLATHGKDVENDCTQFLTSLGYRICKEFPDGHPLPKDELVAFR